MILNIIADFTGVCFQNIWTINSFDKDDIYCVF